jgi:methyl-accepting chemotaxis protein
MTRSKITVSSKTKVEKIDSKNEINFNPETTKKNLQLYFLFTLIVGSILILVVPFTPGYQILASIIVMCFFIVPNYKNTKDISSVRAVFADSVYYLGFLFTFVALVGAMMDLNNNIGIKAIVGSMGPALVTTVIGMAFRIYYTQFDPITDEPEIETVNTLGNLSAQLVLAMDNLNQISKNNSSVLKEFQKSSSQQMEEFANTLTKLDFSKTANQLEKLSNSIDNLNKIGDTLKDEAHRSTIIVENASDKFKHLDNTVDNVNKQLSNLNNFDRDLSDLNEKISSSKVEIVSSVDNAKNTLKDVASKMSDRVGFASREINLSASKITKELMDAEMQAKNFTSAIKTSLNDVVDFLNRHK